MRRALALVGCGVVILTVGAPAQAADYETEPFVQGGVGGTLYYTGGQGTQASHVTFKGDGHHHIIVTETGLDHLLIGEGCIELAPLVAQCDMDRYVPRNTRIQVFLFGGNDYAENDTHLASAMTGGSGRDTLIGGSNEDFLVGNWGKDVLRGRGGNDSLAGGVADDLLVGGLGDDNLDGGFNFDGTPGFDVCRDVDYASFNACEVTIGGAG
jgi:Ca2+-binding RTX toxin-like protein